MTSNALPGSFLTGLSLMSFVTGFLIGALMAVSAMAYAFVSTTLVYRSTFFNGQTVYIKAVRS